MSLILAVIAVLVVLEVAAWTMVHCYRPHFKWLIGPTDAAPEIPEELILKHVAGSFDPDLGWSPKPLSSGSDQTDRGRIEYQVDSEGRRRSPGIMRAEPQVVVYGDSYAFCRLVADDETWPHQLAQLLGSPVSNYGVGNYGIDQALLRFERMPAGRHERVVIMAIVPETIARIQSFWKHYLEYGNILAFKPRFRLIGERLEYVPPAVRSADGYRSYRTHLDEIQSLDGFYESKFCADQVSFPYVWHLLRRRERHVPILANLVMGSVSGDWDARWRKAFGVVLRDNSRLTMKLFKDQDAVKLLEAIVARFCAECRKKGVLPLLVVLPQPVDLDRCDEGSATHQPVFEKLRDQLDVADLTQLFLSARNRDACYVHGGLGPHLSREGNELVARTLEPAIKALLGKMTGPGANAGTSTGATHRENHL